MSLVRVTAVGICGSDLHWWDEGAIGDAKLTHPLVLGHEGAGVIADGPRRGERVAIDPAIPDETCRACRDGYRNLCYRIRFSGHGETDGMLREVMAWPSGLLHPLPDGVSDADGAMLEPLGVAIHSADLGHLPFAGAAAVIGCGPIGLLLIGVLKAAGASSVLAVEPLAHRREAAARLGADQVADSDGALDDAGVDVAFEAAGNDEAVGLAMASVRPGGRVVLAARRAGATKGGGPAGVGSAAGRFLAGRAGGWLVTAGLAGRRAWQQPFRLWPVGVGAWLGAVILGMVFRVVSGQGTAPAFVG